MKIQVKRQAPVEPPIEEVTLVLTPEDAYWLAYGLRAHFDPSSTDAEVRKRAVLFPTVTEVMNRLEELHLKMPGA